MYDVIYTLTWCIHTLVSVSTESMTGRRKDWGGHNCSQSDFFSCCFYVHDLFSILVIKQTYHGRSVEVSVH